MPKVPERPLSQGERSERLRRISRIYYSPGTTSFAEVQPVKSTKHSSAGYIKKYKLADKHLISEQIANQNHIRSISKEV